MSYYIIMLMYLYGKVKSICVIIKLYNKVVGLYHKTCEGTY